MINLHETIHTSLENNTQYYLWITNMQWKYKTYEEIKKQVQGKRKELGASDQGFKHGIF